MYVCIYVYIYGERESNYGVYVCACIPEYR
jgi:hypothetical protein